MVIWKYELAIVDTQTLWIPNRAKLLSVANQRGALCLWALIQDDQARKESREIEIVGTGNPMRNLNGLAREFIGSAVIDPFVWHVFEVR